MTLEYRGAAGEIRSVNDSDRTFELRIVNYAVADSYGSVWEPGVFEESLRSKLPSAAWNHDWSRIIGSLKEYDERSDGLDGLVKFADFEHVPDAKMAWSLLKDGHIKDTSFGFKREDWTDTRGAKDALEGERERLKRARLDEVSPVLVGAVPGAQAVAVRSEGKVSRMTAGQLLAAVATGQMDLRDALNALEERNENEPPKADDKPAEERSIFELREEDAQEALALMQYDRLVPSDFGTRVSAGTLKNPGATKQLMDYWSKGEGAAKIRWGTPGDHTRCVRLLGKYVPPGQVHGLCTNLEQKATGKANGGRADDTTEEN